MTTQANILRESRLPSIDDLHEALRYDSQTGELVRRVIPTRAANINGRFAGRLAGGVDREGYLRVRVGGRRLFAHRVIWAMHHREWPEHHIDHIDGDRANNRIENLRAATNAENSRNRGMNSNNTSGFKGVSYVAKDGMWRALIGVDGKRIWLGRFADKKSAAAAYRAAAVKYHGEFASPM